MLRAAPHMVGIAQLVRAADCGSEGRGFESRYPPFSNHSPNLAARPPADFFGFFGALKKGEFFGVHPKKVGPGRRAWASCFESRISAQHSKSFPPRRLRERCGK